MWTFLDLRVNWPILTLYQFSDLESNNEWLALGERAWTRRLVSDPPDRLVSDPPDRLVSDPPDRLVSETRERNDGGRDGGVRSSTRRARSSRATASLLSRWMRLRAKRR